MGRPIDIKSFKRQNRATYNRIYAEGYQDAYRELKSSGKIQLYRITERQKRARGADSVRFPSNLELTRHAKCFL